MMIKAVPVTYAGVRFRSTLEADWAATLDHLGIIWQYEPEAIELESGKLYRPDFYLPYIATWLEVKGPMQDRIDKTMELAYSVWHHPYCEIRPAARFCPWAYAPCCPGEYQHVVIGYAPGRGLADWRLIDLMGCEDDRGCLNRCESCGHWFWYGLGAYGCRSHRRFGYGDQDLGEGYLSAWDVHRLCAGDGIEMRKARFT